MHFALAPFIYENNYWAAFTDVAMLWSMCCRKSAVERTLVPWQLLLFYSASGFWKINAAFMDPTVSCPLILVFQLAAEYWPSTPSRPFLAAYPPSLRAFGEIALGFTSVFSTNLGRLTEILLHVAMCPFSPT